MRPVRTGTVDLPMESSSGPALARPGRLTLGHPHLRHRDTDHGKSASRDRPFGPRSTRTFKEFRLRRGYFVAETLFRSAPAAPPGSAGDGRSSLPGKSRRSVRDGLCPARTHRDVPPGSDPGAGRCSSITEIMSGGASPGGNPGTVLPRGRCTYSAARSSRRSASWCRRRPQAR